MSLPILSPHIQRIAQEAKADPNRVFTNLAHLIDEELLRAAFWRTRKDGAPGVDGVTGRRYEQHLEENLRDLHRRVKDGGIDRLIGKWLNAGVLEAGELLHPERGTPQGGVLSPLLANVYLHYVLDEWFEQDVRPRLRGRALLIRYADDFIIGCEREEDARRIMEVLPKRLGKYGLSLHSEKSRLVRFHRRPKDAPADPENGVFDFLGFTHYWGQSHRGYWVIKRRTMSKRQRRALKGLWQWCKTHRHDRVREQHVSLCRKLGGLYQYYGIRGNSEALKALYGEVVKMWKNWLGRCSQKSRLTWKDYQRLLERLPLPEPRIFHWSI